MKVWLPFLAFLTLAAAPPPSDSVAAAASCESLASLSLPHTTITRAQLVPAGQFAGTPAGILEPGAPSNRPYNALPAFCRIAATLAPSSDSDIKIEVWMPAETWNGKLQAIGGGGWAGQISVQQLAVSVGRGYAATMTDTGHSGGSGSFAFGHPEKLVDFAYRAVHEMTVAAKVMLQAFYGRPSARNYWVGCSTGGRQGLKEAQRYPEDYDGIVAGAPANYMTHLMTSGIWIAQASLQSEASLIPLDKLPAIHAAVLAACDARDGVTDGVLDDPRQCHFDPKSMLCPAGDAPSCLTAAQVKTAQQIYAPVTNPRTGAEIFPGLERGSEMGWGGMAGTTPFPISTDYYKYILFKDPAWDYRTLTFDDDIAKSDLLDRDGATMNAIDPDLGAFVKRGGKLLLYHGWNDQLIAPRNTVNYYESVVKQLGGAAATTDAIRLFMMPGAVHCAGGDGPSNFDSLAIMEQWVEAKQPPSAIVATHLASGSVDRSRPLCPYPQVAVYKGTGDTNSAASFSCAVK